MKHKPLSIITRPEVYQLPGLSDEAHRLDGETRVIEPERIQLRRQKGWRIPENTIVVSRPSKWGNPYAIQFVASILREYDCDGTQDPRQRAVEAFRCALAAGMLPFTVEDVRRELKGRNLACWFKLPEPGQSDHCHARVLLDIAAGEEQ